MNDELVRTAEQRLREAREKRQAIAPLTDDLSGLDLAHGYAVQRLARDGAGELVGWKLGVTSRAKQVQVGVDSPIRGYLTVDHALDARRTAARR